MNSWLIIILVILVANFILETVISVLNLKALSPQLPSEFKDVFDDNEYEKSQRYTRVNTGFSLIESSTTLVITIAFLLSGGFQYIDVFARSFNTGPIITGLIFTAALAFLSFLLSLPFTLYTTFIIEERFGFNRTTIRTFLLDIVKGIILAVLLGGPILALILWFFESTGNYSWLYCWIGVVVFSFLVQLIAPVLILPLFNKFTPLQEGSLKEKILQYAQQQNFSIQGIFTMDGSKRSSKLNAFFTGFGKFRKIVFYDTLMEKLSDDEIVAVLAHEMGHFKLKHIYKMLAASIMQTGIMFFLLSLILKNRELFDAFQMEHVSIYASLIFFGFLYSPINTFISILFNMRSRKHEYEADEYSANTTGYADNLISSLKKLSQANLSNLTPHPLHVFFHYSHPPVLQRINALRMERK